MLRREIRLHPHKNIQQAEVVLKIPEARRGLGAASRNRGVGPITRRPLETKLPEHLGP